jgi:hypothetical protein
MVSVSSVRQSAPPAGARSAAVKVPGMVMAADNTHHVRR